MKLSVIIPVYNGGQTLAMLVKRLQPILKAEAMEYELIFVNDGSSDKTEEIVKEYIKNPKVKLITQKERVGKVNAINKFLKIAKSDILILESADTIPNKHAITDLLKKFEDPKVGVKKLALSVAPLKVIK